MLTTVGVVSKLDFSACGQVDRTPSVMEPVYATLCVTTLLQPGILILHARSLSDKSSR